MTFLPKLASGSVAGKPVLVAATASPGTTLHTTADAADDAGLDEIWIWAFNNHTTSVTLTLQFGGTADKDHIVQTIPNQQGMVLVVPGCRLNAATVVKAFASVADVVSCLVSVNRYTA